LLSPQQGFLPTSFNSSVEQECDQESSRCANGPRRAVAVRRRAGKLPNPVPSERLRRKQEPTLAGLVRRNWTITVTCRIQPTLTVCWEGSGWRGVLMRPRYSMADFFREARWRAPVLVLYRRDTGSALREKTARYPWKTADPGSSPGPRAVSSQIAAI
jgi:hypothetical protein